MAKYVPDVRTQRWVIIAQARTARPSDVSHKLHVTEQKAPVCPFCPGNEHFTPPEVYRIGKGGKEEPGWEVRIVPNKFPITDIHEVFIHSTNHDLDVCRLPEEQVVRLFRAYRDRYIAHENEGHVIIFCNHGKAAGASLAHPHSQLVVVPKQINLDSLSREPVANIVEEMDGFITYCPDFSQWPYELWIAPKEEGGKFSDTKEDELPVLVKILQRSLHRISIIHDRKSDGHKEKEPFVYNYYISHGDNWFIRIIPRFIHRAGFELGSGLNVNIIDPTQAAEQLQSAQV